MSGLKKYSTYVASISTLFLSGVAYAHAQGLQNPLEDIDTFEDFIAAILEAIIRLGFPILVLFIIYSGFLFVTAQGNEDKLKKAKTTFYWTIVGAAIFLGSWTLSLIIENTVGLITG